MNNPIQEAEREARHLMAAVVPLLVALAVGCAVGGCIVWMVVG